MGLGMTNAEWEDLKAQVDDSFWVLRILGLLATVRRSTPRPNLKWQDTLLFPLTIRDSLVEPTGKGYEPPIATTLIIICFRDYGCLT